MSYCVLFFVLYRKESANKRYRNSVNNLISPNTAVSQNDEKPRTVELDDTAIPHVKIKITEIPRDKKPNTANTVNPHVPWKYQERWKQGRLLNRASNITNLSPRFCVYKWASSFFTGIVLKFQMHVHNWQKNKFLTMNSILLINSRSPRAIPLVFCTQFSMESNHCEKKPRFQSLSFT